MLSRPHLGFLLLFIRLIFVEASAKTSKNVEEAFFETGRKIVDMIKSGELNIKDEVIVAMTTVCCLRRSAVCGLTVCILLL